MKECKVALIGNPNVGKSSLFNALSGLHQNTGNYPGITVDVSQGEYKYNDVKYVLTDFPGTYSLYPNSVDEEIVFQSLIDENSNDYPDKVVVIIDPLNLKRSLLLFLQVRDLGFPTLLVFNFLDTVQKKGIVFDEEQIRAKLENEIIFTNARSKESAEALKKAIANIKKDTSFQRFEPPIQYQKIMEEIYLQAPQENPYKLWMALAQKESRLVPESLRSIILPYHEEYKVVPKRLQVVEAIRRYDFIEKNIPHLFKNKKVEQQKSRDFTNKLDTIIAHPFWGYVIFTFILFGIFQSMFTLAQFPMDMIEGLFANMSDWSRSIIPNGPLQNLIAEGIIPGIGGIVVFIPLIAILFFILILLEEIGYMSRVVFLMDRLLKPLGLSGKSVVPLISGVACAIPAIMSARNIENAKERLITKLVAPFMTCSARLPVYSIIIAIIIPKGRWMAFDNRAVAMMLMYLLGVGMALFSAWILKKVLHSSYKSYLVLDMPTYKVPILSNVLYGLYRKVLDFVVGAGKIILTFSIILWVLGSFGPNTQFEKGLNYNKIPLEESFLGQFGKSIEPAIQPLGYDWKIGIGLISSFAAREVFVSTMATIYSIDEDEEGENTKLTDKLKKEVNHLGKPVYGFATGVSLLLFYAFAMQCMSTLATLKKETNSWKWPILQMIGMTSVAYLFALIAYQILK